MTIDQLFDEIVAFLKNEHPSLPMPYPETRRQLIEKIEEFKKGDST